MQIKKGNDLKTMDPLSDWESPDIPLLVVDEIRAPFSGGGDEFVSFFGVLTSTRVALDVVRHIRMVRLSLPKQAQERSYKGSVLFGSRKSKLHEPIRRHLFKTLANMREIGALTTTSTKAASLRQNFNTLSESSVNGTFISRELGAVMHLINAAICLWGLGTKRRLDVVIDRSGKLGLDPHQRGLKNDELEMFKYVPSVDELKKSYTNFCGFASDFHVRLFPVPCNKLFRELILIPDALAYLAKEQELLKDARRKVKDGELLYFNWLNIEDWARKIRGAGEKPW